MNTDTPVEPQKRKLTFVRVAIVLVVLCIVALPILHKKHDALVDICSSDKGDLQTTLDACDLLLDWTVSDPAERSLAYRNKMRLYMGVKDWEAAKREADLAVAADPDSYIPWEWKARVLEAMGDTDGMVDARLTAFDLQPDDPDALRGKYQLLVGLYRHAAVDEFVSGRLREDKSLGWLFGGVHSEMRRLVESPSLYPLTQIAFLEKTLEVRDQFASDPEDWHVKIVFIALCQVAGAKCPPLYPDRREGYPKINCDETMAKFDAKYPRFIEEVVQKGGPNDIHSFVADEPEWTTVLIQARYIAAVGGFLAKPSHEMAGHLLSHDQMFHCVSGGEFLLPERHTIRGFEPTYPREDAKKYLPREFRRNLVDLAYVYRNAPGNTP
ncbi:tetratricopeptide repeat protein [Ruegeria sp. MALMAid1280]|uniref:tetratricopeptide repeat protein n=1 Tax=Ruegeria sp. MALMAid1280 TaxID=3411634 RepID=UPI003BA24EB6